MNVVEILILINVLMNKIQLLHVMEAEMHQDNPNKKEEMYNLYLLCMENFHFLLLLRLIVILQVMIQLSKEILVQFIYSNALIHVVLNPLLYGVLEFILKDHLYVKLLFMQVLYRMRGVLLN